MARRKAPAIPNDLLDQLLAGRDAAVALNSGGLVNALKKALAERALNAEMYFHQLTASPSPALLSVIRRWYYRDMIPISDISRRTGNSVEQSSTTQAVCLEPGPTFTLCLCDDFFDVLRAIPKHKLH